MIRIPCAPLTTAGHLPWYCVHTKRAKEHWVARQLAESCDEVYLPRLRHWCKFRRRFMWKIESLFPGYLFARFSLQERFQLVRYTPGVLNVLSTISGEPLTVNEEIISTLRERSQDGYIQVSPVPFRPGEELEITEG